jgi:hypothetical protein
MLAAFVSSRIRLPAASKVTVGDLQIISRIAVFRGLKPDTASIAPASTVLLKARECCFARAIRRPRSSS